MKLKIFHLTRYTYSEPVFLEPQYLQFHPQQRPSIKVEDFQLQIKPSATGIHATINADNNLQHQCWFNDLVSQFEIEAHIEVMSKPFNPFAFFIDHNKPEHVPLDYLSIPLMLDDTISQHLNTLDAFEKDRLAPLNQLLDFIHSEFDHEVRYEEDIHHPNECFQKRKGSCRDLSWMLVNMLRHLDYPARFVSGYAFNPELGEGHELHAWVECLIPGAGWIGLDPSAGMFTTEAYIPVATSHMPKFTLPVTGTIRGSATAKLETQVRISQVP